MMPTTYRSGASRVLAAATVVICVVGLLALLLQDGLTGLLRYGWWILLVAVLAWALFWKPHVRVDDAGVELVNVVRTITLPWPSIQDVDTKWALTLKTAYGSFGAWAAPAPGRHGTRRVTDRDLRHLPRESFDANRSIRPGDTPASPSGQAAWVVRERWEELRDAGHLDNPRLEFERVPVNWHVGTIVAVAALCALGITGLLL